MRVNIHLSGFSLAIECQWAIKVTLYDVCKWLCYEMSPSVRKWRSVEVTRGLRGNCLVDNVPLWKGVITVGYACVAGWRCIAVTEWMFPPTCSSVHCSSPPLISSTLISSLVFPSSLLSVYAIHSCPNIPSFSQPRGASAEHLHCSYRISWPTFTVLRFVMTYTAYAICALHI